jgi:hypothetical protein
MSFSNTALYFSSSSITNDECYDSWHDRLGHVNFNIIKTMMHLNLVPKSHINKEEKCVYTG